jgi:hypothetical protein
MSLAVAPVDLAGLIYRLTKVAEMRKIAAGAAGLIVAPAVSSVLTALAGLRMGTGGVEALWLLLLLYYLVSLALALAVGLPIFLVLLALGFVRWWTTAATGIVIGIAVYVGIRYPNVIEPEILLMTAIIGAAAASSFFLVWQQANRGNSGAGVKS